MYKILRNASLVGTGAALTVISVRKSLSFHRCTVLAESIENNDADKTNRTPDLDLELKQVQVFFRHGARTPLHVLEGYRQMSYDIDLVMRPHVMTLFPLERISLVTGLPCDWSAYEKSLRRKNVLYGGSIPGHLTGLGQEQMYALGLRIRDAYQKPLGLSTFDPDVFFVLSSNISRTVESARCVIAGIYGHSHLQTYASQHGPIKILVSESPDNFLIPDTSACSLLRKVNHASLLHFDFIESMKTDREEVEKCIDKIHDLQIETLANLQNDINKILDSRERKASNGNDDQSVNRTITYNSYRQAYSRDEQLHKVLQLRDQQIDNVHHFWHNAIAHHPILGKQLLKDDLKALLYLRRIEVEEFHLKFQSGYRFRFHFDSNPYFHNRVICKEVHRLKGEDLATSPHVTDIQWKKGKDLTIRDKSTAQTDSNGMSFFSWLYEQVGEGDPIGDCLKEVWKNPMAFYHHISYKMDHSTTKKINFVFLYDDMTSRVAHGWWYPKELLRFKKMTEKNGARMMFYAMTGRHKLERPVITSLSTGRMLADMVGRAESFMRGENQQRICLYSSHDSTLVAFLESLGLWRGVWPPFGSDVRLEIYQDKKSSKFYVKVLYQGQAEKIRGQNDDLIEWKEFCRVVERYLLDQEKFELICASNFLEDIAKDVLKHEEGELLEGKKSKRISETPAGM